MAWQALQQAFKQRGLTPPEIAVQSSDFSLRAAMIGTSELVGFSSERIMRAGLKRYGLKTLRLKEWSWRRSVGIRYRKEAYLPTPARELIRVLKDIGRKVDDASPLRGNVNAANTTRAFGR